MNTSKKHSKHAKLTRPSLGRFGRSELALVGAPCGEIQVLAKELITDLSDEFSLAYMDADHKAFDNALEQPFIDEGAQVYWLDQQHMESAVYHSSNEFDRKLAFQSIDLALINGNHFSADAQFIFLDQKKLKSLDKRAEQLTNVLGIIQVDCDTPGEGVQELVPDWNELPVYQLSDKKAIASAIKAYMVTKRPQLNALILVGGKSTRMGRDKASLNYGQEPQYKVLEKLLSPWVEETYLSCRSGQDIDGVSESIVDRFEGLGPMGAILSAFQKNPNHAWLVVACDLPFLDDEVIKELIDNRSTRHIATAFQNEQSGFAEPLITIWEPKSYSRLLAFLGMGYSCPRKVLINSNTHLIQPSQSYKLQNVNTPEEYDLALRQLKNE